MVSSGNGNKPIIIAFDVSAILIIVCLLLVAVTAAVSRQIQRKATWFNLMLPVALYQTSFLLLLGGQGHTQQPSALCTFQAVLIYAIPVYCATSFACFVIDFFRILRKEFYGILPSKTVSILLLVTPVAAFLVVLIIDLSLILPGSSKLEPVPDVSGVYCHIKDSLPSYLTVGFSVPGICVWFVVYYKAAMLLRRKKSIIAQYDAWLRKRILSAFIRTTITTIAAIVGVGLGIRVAAVPTPQDEPISVIQYLALPFGILIVFGTQTEFFKCWVSPCRRSTEVPFEEEKSRSSFM